MTFFIGLCTGIAIGVAGVIIFACLALPPKSMMRFK